MFEDTNDVQPAATQAEWDAVRAEVASGDAPAAKVEEATAVTPAAVAAPAAEVVDPYAGLHPDVKAKLDRFDAMLVEQPKLLQALRETQGRVSAMQRDFATRPATAAQPNEAVIAAAAKDPEKWAALKKDFPEWGEGIQSFVDARFEALGKSGMTPEQIEQVVAQRVGSATEAMAGQFQEMLIETKFPDWRVLVKTPAFGEWFNAQKPEVQALQNSDKGRDVLVVLDLFNESKKQPVAQVRQTRQQVLAAAVQGKPVAPAATKTAADMTPAELWNYEAQLRKARAGS